MRKLRLKQYMKFTNVMQVIKYNSGNRTSVFLIKKSMFLSITLNWPSIYMIFTALYKQVFGDPLLERLVDLCLLPSQIAICY